MNQKHDARELAFAYLAHSKQTYTPEDFLKKLIAVEEEFRTLLRQDPPSTSAIEPLKM
ncbi:hypothetical protein [Nissabacter sp. SGAir0207]|uniref:hypothetical protein n=1 Tax=Nissabacter sp. SGAir0207 TaxID=2126321 RepID=UPI00143D006E|nr:hypothetical protein [Nissabacter sp. SGAir0207]